MARARQYANRVNVIKMVKVGGRWPFARVVERNGRIIRDHVWVAGQDEHHSEGRYYLEGYEEGRRRRKSVESFDLVLPAARAKSIELSAAKVDLLTQPEASDVQAEPARLTMDAAIDQYLEYIRKHRSLRTSWTYRPVLRVHFRNSYAKIEGRIGEGQRRIARRLHGIVRDGGQSGLLTEIQFKSILHRTRTTTSGAEFRLPKEEYANESGGSREGKTGSAASAGPGQLPGVSPQQIYKMAAKGEIQSFKVANAVRFDPHETAKWLKEKYTVRAVELRFPIAKRA